MSVAPGTRLGPYEITAKLGEGGMGEVYRATDTKLRREVAIKVLPAAFAADRERLARFEREAQLLAQLHHPRVASIFGLEESEGVRALVMELVEGPTLAERLEGGPLPLEAALAIARQIAEALEAAHEKGIVHRDLKPQNVKLTGEDEVKVLDFGLAKAMDPHASASAVADVARSPTLMNSPTLTAVHGTQLGVILGTAAYMSPEQARGGAVDKRADIWAFGVVLFEMLSGRRLFAGETVSDTLAAVLRQEIDWDALPRATPPALRTLLRRCLNRSTKERLHDIADARIVLAELERGEGEARAEESARVSVARREPRRSLWALAAALVVVGALLGAVAARFWPRPTNPPVHFHLVTSESGFVHSARFAPDGKTIIYGEARGGKRVTLYSTRSDAVASRPLDLPSADVVGIADNGEMALILDRHHVGSWLRVGTLAQAGVAGGAARARLEGIYDADIARDASAFAIVRYVGAEQQLEYPIGTVLFRTAGWISAPRIARDGRRVAFIEHPLPGDDMGFVALAEADGKVRRLSDGLNFLHGLAWSPDSREVYASFGSADQGAYIDAIALGGARRRLLGEASSLRLQDVAPSGELLMTSDAFPVAAEGRLAADERNGSFTAWSGDTIDGIASDGSIFVGTTGGVLSAGEYQAFFRRADGSATVLLGEGSAVGITPDGRWVFVGTLSRDRSKLRAVPTGTGEARTFDLHGVEPLYGAHDHVSCSTDGQRIAFAGVSGKELPRGYVFDLAGNAPPRAVTPEGMGRVFLSPDGRSLVAAGVDGAVRCFDVANGSSRPAPGVLAGELPVAWASTNDAIFVWDQTIPVRVQRVDLTTGQRQQAFEWQPADPSGVLYGLLTATPDARYFLVRYRRGVSSLAIAEGVR